MTKALAIITQIFLIAIAYEFACLPAWQYLITVGLIMLAHETGRWIYVRN